MAYSHLNMPWILIGDYNINLSSQEHARATDYLPNPNEMRHFQDLISDCGLSDLSAIGEIFTWWNKQEGYPIGTKLDRALVNGDWLRFFPYSQAHFEAGGISDHTRCSVCIADRPTGNRKPFRFFNYLADHNQFIPTVQRIWDLSPPVFHSRMALHLFHRKLKLLKSDLCALNRTQYGDITSKTREAYEALYDRQNETLVHPNDESFRVAAEALDRWNHLAAIEEKFYQQKSCVKWLRVGDRNTPFSINRFSLEMPGMLSSPFS